MRLGRGKVEHYCTLVWRGRQTALDMGAALR
jgi:hypothetical protein